MDKKIEVGAVLQALKRAGSARQTVDHRWAFPSISQIRMITPVEIKWNLALVEDAELRTTLSLALRSFDLEN